jgi:catalase
VQLFRDEESTPVNDAAKVWSAESVVVGELVIGAAPAADDEATINQMAFNPGNGFDPVGITHARADVYAASAKNRADRGLLTSEEARRFLAARPAAG